MIYIVTVPKYNLYKNYMFYEKQSKKNNSFLHLLIIENSTVFSHKLSYSTQFDSYKINKQQTAYTKDIIVHDKNLKNISLIKFY